MHCPRAQPAVAGLNGLLYVMGGRNSKKVELKSMEVYDPNTDSWTLIEDLDYGLCKKRWASAAVPHGLDNILLIGGRGKWASNTVEVFSAETRRWQLVKQHRLQGHDKRYAACVVLRPDRWGMT